jgi:hypothetical protein
MDSLDHPTRSPRTGQRRGAVLDIENHTQGGDGRAPGPGNSRVDAATLQGDADG